jgi:hypothetical protein
MSQQKRGAFIEKAEIAELAGVPISRVWYWDRKGLIPRIKPAGTRLILHPRAETLSWLNGEVSTRGGDR